MIDPDVSALLDANSITSFRQDLADGKIANDDVGDILDIQRDTLKP